MKERDLLKRRRHISENNIQMEFRLVGRDVVDWILKDKNADK
jgi:hypothetical protein